MKRFLTVLFLSLLFSIMPVTAKSLTVKVIALQCFSTEFPLSTFNVQVVESEYLGDGIILNAGTIIAGSVVRIEKPKRGKRDASFEFIPTCVSYKGKTKQLNNPMFSAQVVGYTPVDPEKLVISAARTAAGFFVKGVSQGISFTQGVVEAEEGTRLKAGFTKMYKDSPLSYIEQGDELKIDVGDILILKLKTKKNKISAIVDGL